MTLNKTFDTYVDSTALELYLSSLAPGKIVLIGAVDEASTQLSSQAALRTTMSFGQARALMAQCGARLADGIAYRSSYALICQGGTALAEARPTQGLSYSS